MITNGMTYKTVRRQAVPGDTILVMKTNRGDEYFGDYKRGDVREVVWRGMSGIRTDHGDILLDDEYRVIEGWRPATLWDKFKEWVMS